MKLSKEAKVGLLVIISSTILYTGFNFLKGKDYFSSTNTYYVMYPEIDGLTKSNTIVLNGFAIGRVEEIEMLHEKGDSLKVTLSVNDDILIPKGTVAILADDGLLNGKIIRFQLGKENTLTENKSFITGVKEGGFAAAIAEVATPVIENLDHTIINVNKLFEDSSASGFPNTLKTLNHFTKNLDSVSTTAVSSFKRHDKSIAQLEKNMQSVMITLNATMKKLEPLMGKFEQFADSLNDLELQGAIAEMKTTMIEYKKIASNLNEGNGSMGKLMTDETLYNNLNTAVQRMNLIMYNFDTDPKQYLAPLGQSQKKIMKKRKANNKIEGHYQEFD